MWQTLVGGLNRWFRPTFDALFGRNIPWTYRWRMLLMQPLAFITYSIHSLPYLYSRPFKTKWIKVSSGQTLRILILKDVNPRFNRNGELRPLHLDIHGGAFIGGQPEEGLPFLRRLAKETGAVVISTSYRFAPRYPFPAAIDDVDGVVKYLQDHAVAEWGANPELMTVSGWSAGGNLALAASQQPTCHLPSTTAFKGYVSFYGVVSMNQFYISQSLRK